MEPVVTCLCDEKNVQVERHIYGPIPIDMNTLHIIWEKSRPFKNLFNKEARADFSEFIKLFAQIDEATGMLFGEGLFWRVDDFVGIYYLTDIYPGFEAKAHFTFFDKRLKGRLELTKELLRHIFKKYHFRRLTVELPKYVQFADDPNGGPKGFIKALGFQAEGRKRKAAIMDNVWFDVNIYGIIPEDLGLTYESDNGSKQD